MAARRFQRLHSMASHDFRKPLQMEAFSKVVRLLKKLP
jgi:hypothetical protein